MAINDLFKPISGQSGMDVNSRHLLPPEKVPAGTKTLGPGKLAKIRLVPEELALRSEPETFTLLLNPNTLTESKASNWVKHNIPGQDHPSLQWVNGTERVVSFIAKVTKDLATNETIGFGSDVNLATYTTTTGSEGFSDFPSKEATLLTRVISNSSFIPRQLQPNSITRKFSLTIQHYLDFYRSLMVPLENKGNKSQVKKPPLIKLEMGTLLGSEEKTGQERYALVNYTINVTKMSPALEPIEADVSFTFIQYNPPTVGLKVNEDGLPINTSAIISNVIRR
jgi:hypothetical protein